MRPFKIAVTGDSKFEPMYVTHGMTQWPTATFYDSTAKVTAFRKAEAELGRTGHLDRAGQEMAKRIAESLRNPPAMDVTLRFSTTGKQDMVEVIDEKTGKGVKIRLELKGISDREIKQTFKQVDAAIFRIVAGTAGKVS